MPDLSIRERGHTLVAKVQRSDDNEFTSEMISKLSSAVRDAREHPSLRFVRIRAAGNVFCGGRERTGSTPEELRAEAERIVDLGEILRTSPLTIVAEVNGDAAGFGVGLIAASDIAVASTEARFRFPEILGGLAPAVVISWLAHTFSYKAAFDLVTTGEPIDAQRAASWGLITEAVPRSGLEARVDERIEGLAALSTPALREVKQFFAAMRGMNAASATTASINALTISALRVRSEPAR